MLIEFLYQKFKFIIYCTLLPLYLASHICLDSLCGKNDELITEMKDILWELEVTGLEEIKVNINDYPELRDHKDNV